MSRRSRQPNESAVADLTPPAPSEPALDRIEAHNLIKQQILRGLPPQRWGRFGDGDLMDVAIRMNSELNPSTPLVITISWADGRRHVVRDRGPILRWTLDLAHAFARQAIAGINAWLAENPPKTAAV